MTLNLATFLEDSARQVPERHAVLFGDTKLTYSQVNAAASQVAHALVEAGIEPGDKVALGCINAPYFPIVYYGILKAGGVVVPLNVLLKPREIAYHLKDSDAKAYFCFGGTEQLPMGDMGYAAFQDTPSCELMVLLPADPRGSSPYDGVQTLAEFSGAKPGAFRAVPRNADDTAVILYTSGTTGQAKGAELSHSNMVMNAALCHHMYEVIDHHVHLVVLPLFHSFGQTVQMNAAFYYRGSISLVPRFEPDAVLKTMERDGVTFFAGVPTMYWALTNHPGADQHDLTKIADNLRLCVSGGAALPVEVLKQFEERFQVPILEGYGLSETSPAAAFNPVKLRKPGSVGPEVWGVSIRIVDSNGDDVPTGEDGEIVIQGHNVMKGYYNRPEETAAVMRNGWFHTGDVGRKDDDGYIYITDRVKDMIIRGGFNVYPREIEEVLMQHPAISLAAVIGVPHDQHGEEIKAFVVLKDGESAKSDELIAWSKERMANYKYPREFELREALPMNATGKILKRELRDA